MDPIALYKEVVQVLVSGNSFLPLCNERII